MMNLELPLTQSEAFERTCERIGVAVTRVSDADGTCLVQTRKLPVLGAFHLISRGPIMQDPDVEEAFIRRIRRQFKGPLVVNATGRTKQSGGLKIAGGAEIATIALMAPDKMRARLHQKWRNQLKKSEAAELVVTDQPLDPLRHKWFLKAEAAQQKARKYKSYPTGFLLAYAAANKAQARLYTAAQNGQPVAGMLVLKHGLMATYQAGVTTPEGRNLCAHNLLLWQILCDLQKRQVTRLDLGRADLSPGLRRFKQGAGAEIEALGGSFLFHHWFAPKAGAKLSGSARTKTLSKPV
ncbi:MAG: GNAT family N-acetyltransferase [Pseudomonadota bacterium]